MLRKIKVNPVKYLSIMFYVWYPEKLLRYEAFVHTIFLHGFYLCQIHVWNFLFTYFDGLSEKIWIGNGSVKRILVYIWGSISFVTPIFQSDRQQKMKAGNDDADDADDADNDNDADDDDDRKIKVDSSAVGDVENKNPTKKEKCQCQSHMLTTGRRGPAKSWGADSPQSPSWSSTLTWRRNISSLVTLGPCSSKTPPNTWLNAWQRLASRLFLATELSLGLSDLSLQEQVLIICSTWPLVWRMSCSLWITIMKIVAALRFLLSSLNPQWLRKVSTSNHLQSRRLQKKFFTGEKRSSTLSRW